MLVDCKIKKSILKYLAIYFNAAIKEIDIIGDQFHALRFRIKKSIDIIESCYKIYI